MTGEVFFLIVVLLVAIVVLAGICLSLRDEAKHLKSEMLRYRDLYDELRSYGADEMHRADWWKRGENPEEQ